MTDDIWGSFVYPGTPQPFTFDADDVLVHTGLHLTRGASYTVTL